MSALEIIFLALAVLGIVVSLYFGLENRKLSQKLRSLAWEDVLIAGKDLARAIGDEFVPDAIFAPDPRGGVIGIQVKEGIDLSIPIITGATVWKPDVDSEPVLNGCRVISTTKWYLLIPESLHSLAEKKLLIVDDLTMSGDSMQFLKDLLVKEFGFKPENVKTCTILASDTSIKTNKAPDFYWKKIDNSDFFFPWGKAR